MRFSDYLCQLMRSLLIYLLVTAVLLPSISSWGTLAYYHLNKDYIARVLCENRDKPQLHCDGKCYLAKQLKAQQDRQDKETTERVQNTALIQLFCEAGFSFVFASPGRVYQRPLFNYQRSVYASPLRCLFHPPCLG